jgi:UDP-2,3-diacylglucosamine pyrophosphatase LpxH
MAESFKFIISDCHLSAGRFYEGQLNPHEDFFFDDEMCSLFEHFSTGPYSGADVELFINGDYFDFLYVPFHGEFEDAITEEIALYKVEAIIEAHPKVMASLRKFASLPKKRISYLIGNHDAELFFPKVRERIVREWDPEKRGTVEIIVDRDRIRWPGGVEVHHGNQFEAGNYLDFQKPILDEYFEKPILNLPWGSFYVLKIVNRLKWEREYLDKVRPVKLFVFFGLILDPWFTIRYVFLSGFYFLKTRFAASTQGRSRLKEALGMVRQESKFFLDLEEEARELLNQEPEVKTVIFGHTHKPMNKVYPDGKQYINTGTWTKMINLDWRSLGQQFALTFALVRIRENSAQCELRHWLGEHGPHRTFHG